MRARTHACVCVCVCERERMHVCAYESKCVWVCRWAGCTCVFVCMCVSKWERVGEFFVCASWYVHVWVYFVACVWVCASMCASACWEISVVSKGQARGNQIGSSANGSTEDLWEAIWLVFYDKWPPAEKGITAKYFFFRNVAGWNFWWKLFVNKWWVILATMHFKFLHKTN